MFRAIHFVRYSALDMEHAPCRPSRRHSLPLNRRTDPLGVRRDATEPDLKCVASQGSRADLTGLLSENAMEILEIGKKCTKKT